MWCEVGVPRHAFSGGRPIVAASFAKETLLFPPNGLETPAKNQPTTGVTETLPGLGFDDQTL